jgi:hypothetical protein
MQVTLRSARLRSDGRLATWPPDLTRTTFPRRLRLVLLLDAEMSYRSEKRALRRALFTLEKTVCCRATWHTLVELTMIPVERHDCPPHSRAPVVDDIVTAASQQLPTYLCPVSSIRGLRLRRQAELARVTVRAVGPLRCARARSSCLLGSSDQVAEALPPSLGIFIHFLSNERWMAPARYHRLPALPLPLQHV